MANVDLLRHFVELRTGLADANVREGRISGILEIATESLPRLRELVDAGLVEETAIQKADGRSLTIPTFSLSASESVELTVSLQPTNLSNYGCAFFETLDDLIGRHPVILPDVPYHVYDTSYSSWESPPPLIECYQATSALGRLLRELSDFERTPNPPWIDLIFFHRRKIEVRLRYTTADLVAIRHIEQLHDELFSHSDKAPRRQIFRQALVEELLPVDRDRRFPHLLEHFESVFNKYRNSHQLYLEDFSYEELRSAFEEKKVMFVSALHGVVTDAQSKLVAIPIAFLAVAAGLRPEDGISIPNIAVLLGAWIFSWLLHILVKNQENALEAINSNVSQLKDRYASTADSPLKLLSDGFRSLGTQYDQQCRRLRVLRCIVWLVAITASILFALAVSTDVGRTHASDTSVSSPTSPLSSAPGP